MRTLSFTTPLEHDGKRVTVEVTAEITSGIRATMIDPDEPAYADLISVTVGDDEIVDDLDELERDYLEERALEVAEEDTFFVEPYDYSNDR